jgi:hypothetical protein
MTKLRVEPEIILTPDEARAIHDALHHWGTDDPISEEIHIPDVMAALQSIRRQIGDLQPKRWEDELLEWAEGEMDVNPHDDKLLIARRVKLIAIIAKARGEKND